MKSLKKLRGKHGITQVELAEILNIKRPYVSLLESDEVTELSPALTQKVCDYFKIKPWELYGINNLKYIPETKEELDLFIETIIKEYR